MKFGNEGKGIESRVERYFRPVFCRAINCALRLASALFRWLTWGWSQFSNGGVLRRRPKKIITPLTFTA